ncbi:MAG: MBL fold metallo-hydrolase [Bacillota bacterium]
MLIRWLGHACFALTAKQGTRILTDPYHEGTGYLMPAVDADFITVSRLRHPQPGGVPGGRRPARGTAVGDRPDGGSTDPGGTPQRAPRPYIACLAPRKAIDAGGQDQIECPR